MEMLACLENRDLQDPLDHLDQTVSTAREEDHQVRMETLVLLVLMEREELLVSAELLALLVHQGDPVTEEELEPMDCLVHVDRQESSESLENTVHGEDKENQGHKESLEPKELREAEVSKVSEVTTARTVLPEKKDARAGMGVLESLVPRVNQDFPAWLERWDAAERLDCQESGECTEKLALLVKTDPGDHREPREPWDHVE